MRRTSLLCVLAVIVLVAMAFPAYAAVELFRVGVENLGTGIPEAPAYIGYTINCTADVTVTILPATSAGVVTGAAVRTVTLTSVPKGKHTFVWAGTKDNGSFAGVGYYTATVAASANPSRWDANIGLFKNWERPNPVHEWGYRDSADLVKMPADTANSPGLDESIGGFYGIGVNNNTASPYYGRIYVPHQVNKQIYMYDVDGTYLGTMDTSAVGWFTSAPWDLRVADDDYVYCSDRTAMYVYCFKPDGSGLVSQSPTITNDRGMFVRTVKDVTSSENGYTYVFQTNGTQVWQIRLDANHVWDAASKLGTNIINSVTDSLYGLWVSPDLKRMYVASRQGDWTGVRKYTRTSVTGNWVYANWTVLSGTACADVELSADESYMWVTRSDGTASTMYKFSTAGATTGTQLANYDIISWGFMLSRDAVGNVACTFGKSSSTWPGKYWGMFAEPGLTTASKPTGVFHLGADPAPVVVPDTETWSYNDIGGALIPDGSDTAQVTFKVMDANGYSDIGSISLDLKELKTTADTNKVQAPDSVIPDPDDPTGTTAICTKAVTAVNGVPFGARKITVTVHDSNTSSSNTGDLHVQVAGNTLATYVRHTRSGGNVVSAQIRAVGGKPGVYGYPFTFDSANVTDGSGYIETPISEGSFQVTAIREGYKSQPSVTATIPYVDVYPGTTVTIPNVMLGPLSIAEARAFQNLQRYVSVEGVCFAQPKGIAPTAALGMDDRMDSYTSATQYTMLRSWYMCDATDAGSGLLFMLKPADTTFKKQWDDSAKKDPITFASLYLGKRPADGDTLCVSGWLESRPGYETRVILDDGYLATAGSTKYKEIYYNLTAANIVPAVTLPTPVLETPNDVNTSVTVPWAAAWGKYAKIQGVKVLRWVPDGRYVPDNTFYPVDPNKFVVVADSLNRWCTVTFQSTTSYGLSTTACPVTLGNTYTFTGAGGKRCRYGEGTLRVRGAADILQTGVGVPPSVGPDTVGAVRGVKGSSVTVRGTVTLRAADGTTYIENSDRSVGIRVTSMPWWINVGDDVQVTGNVTVGADGVKQITPVNGSLGAPMAITAANPLPELGMRHRDVGGKGLGVMGTDGKEIDPGVTNYRGPLNVGLYVTVQGMVTYRDSTGAAPYFYIWDGTNMYIPGEYDARPLEDGSGYRGLRIANSGYMAAPLSRGLKAYQDFVTVKGIVGTTTVNGVVVPQIIVPDPTKITVETAFDTVSSSNALVANANLISLPASPAGSGNGIDPTDDPSLNPMPWSVPTVFAPNDPTDGSATQIYRWENGNMSQYQYDMWSPDLFGGCVMGDGYWIFLSADWPISYKAKLSSIPQWLTIGQAGDVWLGLPKNATFPLENVLVHDGTAVRTIRDVNQNGLGWFNSSGFWWKNDEQSQYDVGLAEDWPSGGSDLEPWHGYTFYTNVGDLAWIIK